MGFEVTTAASGDVGRQALVFFLGLGKPFPWGVIGWCWAWKLSQFGLFAWFGTTFFLGFLLLVCRVAGFALTCNAGG